MVNFAAANKNRVPLLYYFTVVSQHPAFCLTPVLLPLPLPQRLKIDYRYRFRYRRILKVHYRYRFIRLCEKSQPKKEKSQPARRWLENWAQS